jgi:hypothetical protein
MGAMPNMFCRYCHSTDEGVHYPECPASNWQRYWGVDPGDRVTFWIPVFDADGGMDLMMLPHVAGLSAVAPSPPPFHCPACARTDHAPDDARARYCVECRAFF